LNLDWTSSFADSNPPWLGGDLHRRQFLAQQFEGLGSALLRWARLKIGYLPLQVMTTSGSHVFGKLQGRKPSLADGNAKLFPRFIVTPWWDADLGAEA
jgi:hypothetical protein